MNENPFSEFHNGDMVQVIGNTSTYSGYYFAPVTIYPNTHSAHHLPGNIANYGGRVGMVWEINDGSASGYVAVMFPGEHQAVMFKPHQLQILYNISPKHDESRAEGIAAFEAASGLKMGDDGIVTQELVDYAVKRDGHSGSFLVGVYVWVSDPANGEAGTLKTGEGRTHSAYPPYQLRNIPIDLIHGVVNAYKTRWEAK